jgi:hypothetical protein
MGWGSIIGLVTSYAGGKAQGKAAEKGSQLDIWSQQQATAQQERFFEQAMGYGDPYRQAGKAGIEAYGDVPMGMTEADMMRLQEGTDAMRAMQAAQGRRRAGGSAEQLGQYASGFFEDVYNRGYEDLMGRANIGAQFATGAGQQAMGAGQDIASAYISGARNIAPYITARGQNQANMYAAAGRIGGDILNMYGSGGGRKAAVDTGEEYYGKGWD